MKQRKFATTSYSARHYHYGRGLVMEDIDSIEYDENDLPVALVETKFGYIKLIDTNNGQFKRAKNTAALLGVPAFCVVYLIFGAPIDGKLQLISEVTKPQDLEPHHVQYLVIPLNQRACSFVSHQCQMTELQYVELLYKLRGSKYLGQAEKPLFDRLVTQAEASFHIPKVV